MLHLRKIRDDDGLVYCSRAVDYGDWPFRYFLQLIATADYSREWAAGGAYHVTLAAVSPAAAGPALVARAAASAGLPADAADEFVGEALLRYGVHAQLFAGQGTNRRALLRAARQRLRECEIFFGFVMDRRVNALGATGWDAIRGRAHDPAR